jgi:hypothetical protein
MNYSTSYPPIIFILFLALGSASFGYVVGRNDRNSYFQKQQQAQEEVENNR